ncbi:type I polyketide synthase [Nostoc sp. DedSLP04]|uniref:type I polyketide synthase n=1 Tax=Nostoc sp. DedSLP04 TaxID=3075401 RepID=UPI002AD25E92|nr:type I polyketide synthase [Nostoc sp. DedSLP04]MDZ8033647.1 type I polyketide synthase [Nostoc sp. DedSLP04]
MSQSNPQPDYAKLLKDAVLEIREQKAKLNALLSAKTEPIAIIGMGCRFPGGANDPEMFWQLLYQGKDAIAEVPGDRWDINAYYHPDPDAPAKMNTRYGGFVNNPQEFDPHFFGISAREAISLDPQQRLLLEVTWETLEAAAVTPEVLAKVLTGVFIGICSNDYTQNLFNQGEEQIDAYLATGNSHSIASGRLSYLLGLTGPCLSVDTACSSSLVAVHLACTSLRNQECDVAIAGGVQRLLSPVFNINFTKARMLSADGRCKTFDASADGFVRSEGCGVILLKRLSDAIAAGDNILALIRGSAINQDGHTSGLTVPNGPSQQAVIRRALAASGVEPAQVSYIEAHGTGTSLGDPIEMRALGAVFSSSHSPDRPLIVGSVKTNIGHLEGAAGIAGLMKVVLQLQHDSIAPHLHLKQPNPYIDWSKLAIAIPTDSMAWVRGEKPRLAGVSSFGFSGTNAHVVLEEAPLKEQGSRGGVTMVFPLCLFAPLPLCLSTPLPLYPSASLPLCPLASSERPVHLFCLSAKNERALLQLVERYRTYLETTPELELADVCFTANTGRSHFDYRMAIVAGSTKELVEQLAMTISSGRVYEPEITFLFTGQGSQYMGMGQQLYQTQPTFRKALQECDEILRSELEIPLLEILYPQTDKDSPLNQTAYTQPALFALEYTLYQLWRSWGITPSAVIGHSVGEYVAACIAGVFSLEDGLKLIAARGRLMQHLATEGMMVSLFMPVAQVREIIAPYSEQLSIAAINSPQSTVISGQTATVQAIVTELEKLGVKSKQLQVSHAFHSPLMKPMVAQFESVARQITYHSPHLKLISNITGAIATSEVTTPEYWSRHILAPVDFAASMQTLHQQGYEVFLECSPQPILLGMGRQCLPDNSGVWLPSLQMGQEDLQQMLSSLGQLYVLGAKVNWVGFESDYCHRKVKLPTYPFQRQRYWVETPPQHTTKPSHSLHPLLGERLQLAGRSKEIFFESIISASSPAYLADHRIFEQVIVPGAAYLEMAIAAGANIFQSDCIVLENVAMEQPLILAAQPEKIMQVVLHPLESQGYRFEICSRDPKKENAENPWTVHATGTVLPGEIGSVPKTIDLTNWLSHGNKIDPQAFYQRSQEQGISFGVCFHSLQQLGCKAGLGYAQIELPKETGMNATQGYQIHPILLDAGLQLAGAATLQEGDRSFPYLPIGIERLQVYRRANRQLWGQAEARNAITSEGEILSSDIQLVDPSGAVVAQIQGFAMRRTTRQSLERMIKPDISNWFYELDWQMKSLPVKITDATEKFAVGHWLIFADCELGEQLSQQLTQHGGSCTVVTVGQNYQQLDERHYQINPLKLDDFNQLLHTSCDRQTKLQGVIHLWSLEGASSAELDLDELERSQILGCASVLHLVQALEQQRGTEPIQLWLVTKGSQAVTTEAITQVQQTPLWGLGRAIAMEYPHLKCRRLDLDPDGFISLNLHAIADELFSPDGEDQIAHRQGQRHVLRLVRSRQRTISDRIAIPELASYLIVGGLGTLGLQVAQWLADKGARHLILSGRREPSLIALAAIAKLEQAGVRVLVEQADVSSQSDMTRLLNKIAAELPSLRGIIHAAGILDDGILQQQCWERFTGVMAAKVRGAWLLHQLTQALPLDFFVCFSSAASLIGSPGQGNYAAANAFLDGLAHYRRQQGLAGLSINWGPWEQGGMAAQLGNQHHSRMQSHGLGTISPERGLQALEALLVQDVIQVGIIPANWQQLLAQIAPGIEVPMLQSCKLVAADQRYKDQLLQQLQTAPIEERRELLRAYLQSEIAKVLGLSNPQQVEPQQRLFDLGLDSLTAVELRNRLQTNLGYTMRSTLLFDYPTLAALLDYLAENVIPLQPVELSEEVNAVAVQRQQILTASEDEAEALLLKKLEDLNF